MLLAPKYHDLDLPVYDGEDLVDVYALEPGAYFADTGRTTFIRPVKSLGTPYFENLDKFLKKTDEELKEVAKLCGALVVGHAWGLYPMKDEITRAFWCYEEREDSKVPNGHILAAEVDLITEVKKIKTSPFFLGKANMGIENYYKVSREGQLSDMYDERQFVIGNNANDPNPSESLWLVDIEPFFD